MVLGRSKEGKVENTFSLNLIISEKKTIWGWRRKPPQKFVRKARSERWCGCVTQEEGRAKKIDTILFDTHFLLTSYSECSSDLVIYIFLKPNDYSYRFLPFDESGNWLLDSCMLCVCAFSYPFFCHTEAHIISHLTAILNSEWKKDQKIYLHNRYISLISISWKARKKAFRDTGLWTDFRDPNKSRTVSASGHNCPYYFVAHYYLYRYIQDKCSNSRRREKRDKTKIRKDLTAKSGAKREQFRFHLVLPFSHALFVWNPLDALCRFSSEISC